LQKDLHHVLHKGGGPRQPDLGTRISRYRCFLPDLAGFSTYRREGTDGGHHGEQEGTPRAGNSEELRQIKQRMTATHSQPDPTMIEALAF
jgi:hypothetical protein